MFGLLTSVLVGVTIILIKNFLYREHRDIYLYVLNKLELNEARYRLSLEQEETLKNRSQEYDVDEKQIRKNIYTNKHK